MFASSAQLGEGARKRFRVSSKALIAVGCLVGLTGCLGLREAVAEFRTDITGSLVAMEEAALEREQAFQAALLELSESRASGALTPEQYADELARLMQDDLLAQGREGRVLASELKGDLEDFHDEVEAQIQAARRGSVDFSQLLFGLAATLLGGGGAAAGLANAAAGKAREKANAYADAAALALDKERDLRRMARREPLTREPQGYEVPLRPDASAAIVPTPTVQGVPS